jgi:hypothetical protein
LLPLSIAVAGKGLAADPGVGVLDGDGVHDALGETEAAEGQERDAGVIERGCSVREAVILHSAGVLYRRPLRSCST